MRTKLILPLITFLAVGCNQNGKAQPVFVNKIPLTKEFLIKSEWMLDSIYGSRNFIQDWIFFTPDNKFWRCSFYSASYIIDSAISFQKDAVQINGKTKYKIYTIDSANILLVDATSTVFHCIRWNNFNPGKIANFVTANPKKKLLNGIWKLDSSGISPTKVPSSCNTLYAGTTFHFNPDGTMEIYPRDSTAKCGFYNYKIFGDEISFIEYDMVMGFGIMKITSDSLILKSHIVTMDTWSEKEIKAREEGYELFFTKIH